VTGNTRTNFYAPFIDFRARRFDDVRSTFFVSFTGTRARRYFRVYSLIVRALAHVCALYAPAAFVPEPITPEIYKSTLYPSISVGRTTCRRHRRRRRFVVATFAARAEKSIDDRFDRTLLINGAAADLPTNPASAQLFIVRSNMEIIPAYRYLRGMWRVAPVR